MIINNDDQLNEAINNDKGTLILFSADWCGPCKILKPNLEKVKKSLSESYDFIKVDISQVEETVKKFNIRNIPTCVLTRSGKEISRFSGVKTEEQIKNFLLESSLL
jgi:thioredoxin 1